MIALISHSLRIGLAVGILFLAGCATVKKPPVPVTPPEKKEAPVKGVYHKVRKGETLWRIARAYDVSVEEITRANHIPNAASVEENQLLLIPGADAVRDVVTAQPSAGKDNEFAWPAAGKVVSYFEDRKGAYFNRGIDIRVSDDVVKASRDGRVVFADHLAGYGYAVILDHSDGFYTVYGYGNKLLVRLGDYVFRGEKIAMLAGSSAGASGGRKALVHFEIRKGQIPSNPLYYLP